MKKTKKKDILPKSQLVTELSEVEFIKQPYLYATVGGDFTLTQRAIMIEIINSLQDRFNAFLKNHKEGRQLNLFAEEEQMGKELMTFRIEAASLGVKPDAYSLLDQTCKNMLDMKVTYLEEDKNTGMLRRVYANLFSKISMPEIRKTDGYRFKNKDTRRMNYVEVRMEIDTLKYLCNINNGLGYMNHVRKIARICRRKRTPPIYIYLAKWKDAGHKVVNLLELKKYLGLIEPASSSGGHDGQGTPETDLYPKFSRFCSTVLDPIKEDLDELAAANAVDFTFEYSPVYKNGARRGNPEEIRFDIRLSGLGEELKQKRKRIGQPADVWTLLRTEYKLTNTDVKGLSDMLPCRLVDDFRRQVLELGDMVKKYKPAAVKPYVITVLKNFITARTEADAEQAEEKQEGAKEKKPEAPSLPAETEEWRVFMEVIQNRCTATDYNTWLCFMRYNGFDGHTLNIAVPTAFFQSYIEENFLDMLRMARDTAYGPEAEVEYSLQGK